VAKTSAIAIGEIAENYYVIEIDRFIAAQEIPKDESDPRMAGITPECSKCLHHKAWPWQKRWWKKEPPTAKRS
jgi:hypothetical protein